MQSNKWNKVFWTSSSSFPLSILSFFDSLDSFRFPHVLLKNFFISFVSPPSHPFLPPSIIIILMFQHFHSPSSLSLSLRANSCPDIILFHDMFPLSLSNYFPSVLPFFLSVISFFFNIFFLPFPSDCYWVMSEWKKTRGKKEEEEESVYRERRKNGMKWVKKKKVKKEEWVLKLDVLLASRPSLCPWLQSVHHEWSVLKKMLDLMFLVGSWFVALHWYSDDVQVV